MKKGNGFSLILNARVVAGFREENSKHVHKKGVCVLLEAILKPHLFSTSRILSLNDRMNETESAEWLDHDDYTSSFFLSFVNNYTTSTHHHHRPFLGFWATPIKIPDECCFYFHLMISIATLPHWWTTTNFHSPHCILLSTPLWE